MNLILLLVIGFLVFIGTYMILSINLIRIVIGISIYTHAGNLIIMSMEIWLTCVGAINSKSSYPFR